MAENESALIPSDCASDLRPKEAMGGKSTEMKRLGKEWAILVRVFVHPIGGLYGSRIKSFGNHRRKSSGFLVTSPCLFTANPPMKMSATGRLGTLSVRRAFT